MKKMIVYFHGFGSSPNTDKVSRLKAAFPDDYIYAFPIDIDPEIAEKELTRNINNALVEHLNEAIVLFFIGTSLGGWWASSLGYDYQCTTILINPSPQPQDTLTRYGISQDICEKYSDIVYSPQKDYYFFAKHDEVIEPRYDLSWPNLFIYDQTSVGHRFNGPEFDDVIALINSLASL